MGAFPGYGEADWRRAAEAALKGASLERLVARTSDDIALGPLYPAEVGPRAFRQTPGAWRALARLDHPEAGEANDSAREDLAHGADGLAIVFAGAAGAHGFGLRRWDAETLDRAFDGLRFEAGARFELDLGVEPQAQAEGVAAAVERSGADAKTAEIAFGLDPLGLRARSGRAQRDWADEAAGLVASVERLSGRGFAGPFVVADGRCVHDAGGTPAQELAFAIGAAVAYLRVLGAQRAHTIGFRLSADADQLATLAKFRALRLLWRRVRDACGLPDAPARVHAESAWRMMSARDPVLNAMRAALGGFSAGLGGADSVSLLPFSQAVGLPDAFARRLARNSQSIALQESRLGFVADPAAGAGAFEALTRAFCEKAWSLFQNFEAQAGLPGVLAGGGFQRAVAASAAALARDVARLKTPITGVSAHPNLDEAPVAVRPVARRETLFQGPPFAPALAPVRLAEPFERLRDAAERLAKRPTIFLATLGPASQHGRRVAFAREFFEAGGIAARTGPPSQSFNEVAEHFRASGAEGCCLCGGDEAYAELAAPFARALKQAGAARLWLAGRPGESEPVWREAGVDGYLYAGCDAVATLTEALRAVGAAL